MPFARDYIDMKWPTAAATYRRSLSEALTAITVAMLDNERDRPDPKVLRAALHRWAFNCGQRDTSRPADVDGALRWGGAEARQRPTAVGEVLGWAGGSSGRSRRAACWVGSPGACWWRRSGA